MPDNLNNPTESNDPSATAKQIFKRPTFEEQLRHSIAPRDFVNQSPLKTEELDRRLQEFKVDERFKVKGILESINKINPIPLLPESSQPEDIRSSVRALKQDTKRFHGAKLSLTWFPVSMVISPCGDKFGYMSSAAVRTASKMPFNPANQALLGQLGNMMGDPARDTGADSNIPAGFTYFGQFVDHDITMDISSTLDVETNAETINNMRTPALDLDSLYGRGPGLEPHLYVFPSAGPPTAIKFQLGTNRPHRNFPGGPVVPGGPSNNGLPGGMQVQADHDVPRMHNPLNPPASSNTAIIGDPRNDENLIVSQFHHAMLKFHNKVVDLLVLAAFAGDIFAESKKIVTHHYQWAVVHDYLRRICGTSAIDNALGIIVAPGSAFRMPVEFAVAAYRFGHSLIRNNYWVNFNFPSASLGQVFQFNRNPNIPVLTNWVVDFNAFFTTGVVVPVNNRARKIDSVLANGLETLPGLTGMMAILATRNLRRGLALGLPSGQAMATSFGITPMTPVQLTQGLPPDEVAILNLNSGLLLNTTPLWYYILREATVLQGGNQLGPLGAKIVADTFIRILKRDIGSYLNVTGGFTPMLPSVTAGNFTVADLLIFAGVTQP